MPGGLPSRRLTNERASRASRVAIYSVLRHFTRQYYIADQEIQSVYDYLSASFVDRRAWKARHVWTASVGTHSELRRHAVTRSRPGSLIAAGNIGELRIDC
jgi:hypothetical protein